MFHYDYLLDPRLRGDDKVKLEKNKLEKYIPFTTLLRPHHKHAPLRRPL